MDEKTNKNQDFHQLIYWTKEIFKQVDLLVPIISVKHVNFQAIDNINHQLAKLHLSLNFFKRFMVNFQIKHPSEIEIIDLACKLAKNLDVLIASSKNLDITSFKNNFGKCNPSKILLLMAIIDHSDYVGIEFNDTFCKTET